MRTFPALQTLHSLLQKIITLRDKVLLSSKKVNFFLVNLFFSFWKVRLCWIGSLVWTTYHSYRIERSFFHGMSSFSFIIIIISFQQYPDALYQSMNKDFYHKISMFATLEDTVGPLSFSFSRLLGKSVVFLPLLYISTSRLSDSVYWFKVDFLCKVFLYLVIGNCQLIVLYFLHYCFFFSHFLIFCF